MEWHPAFKTCGWHVANIDNCEYECVYTCLYNMYIFACTYLVYISTPRSLKSWECKMITWFFLPLRSSKPCRNTHCLVGLNAFCDGLWVQRANCLADENQFTMFQAPHTYFILTNTQIALLFYFFTHNTHTAYIHQYTIFTFLVSFLMQLLPTDIATPSSWLAYFAHEFACAKQTHGTPAMAVKYRGSPQHPKTCCCQ